MAKDPAFLFYTNDFLSGVAGLTMEERGQYITMLCLQHQQGFLSDKTIRLTVGSVSVDVLSKFKKDGNGNFFNTRLVEEIEKRSNFLNSRQINGSKGGRPKANANHKVNHMPNLPVNENVNENKDINELLWSSIVKEFYSSFRWKEKFCIDKKLPIETLEAKQKEFIADLELKEDFKDLKELKRHFTNWFNKNKNGQSRKPTADEKLAARIEHSRRYD